MADFFCSLQKDRGNGLIRIHQNVYFEHAIATQWYWNSRGFNPSI